MAENEIKAVRMAGVLPVLAALLLVSACEMTGFGLGALESFESAEAVALSAADSSSTLSCPDSTGECSAWRMDWSRKAMDGSRTGCSAPLQDNVTEALGVVQGRTYFAPNGREFRGGSVVQVASLMLEAQEAMKPLREVVAVCPCGMQSRSPESDLSDWAADVLLQSSEGLFGVKADVSLLNFGGIRCNMPCGDVLLDDLVSMFPFHNQLVLVSLSGRKLQELLRDIVSVRIQPMGGVQLTVYGKSLRSARVGGKAIDPDATYRMISSSFLLSGGDDISLNRYADNVQRSNLDILDVVLDYVRTEAAAGRPLGCKADGRIHILPVKTAKK